MTSALRWGWVVSTTPRQLYPPGKIRYPSYRRLVGPQGRSGRVREISSLPGLDPRTVQPVASLYTDWAIPAPIINSITSLTSFASFHKYLILSLVLLFFCISLRGAMVAVDTAHFQSFKTQLFGHTMYYAFFLRFSLYTAVISLYIFTTWSSESTASRELKL